jgi:polysaccharide biosynthesis protein PslH
MKNIVYITENLDFFSDSGAKIKTLNTIECLSKKFHITILSLNSSKKINQVYRRKFKNIDFHYVVDKNIENPIKKRLLELIYFYIKGIPYYFFQYKNSSFKKLVDKKIKNINPEVIHINHLTMSQYLPKNKRQIWVYEEHNIEHKLRFQMARFSKKIGYHWLIWLMEGILLSFKEKSIWKKFDYIFTISRDDQEYISKYIDKKKIFLQNIFMPVKKTVRHKKNNKDILFIGDLEWLPNRNGIEWFIKKVLPNIPKATLHLVGNVDKEFKNKNQQKNIVFYGYQNNIDSFFIKSSIFIAPLLIGEGVRIKILDAFSRKIPVVATKNATKGLSVKNKKEILIAKNSKEFKNYITNIWGNKINTKNILDKATHYLDNNHSKKENKIYIENYPIK